MRVRGLVVALAASWLLVVVLLPMLDLPFVKASPDADYCLYFDGNDYVQIEDAASLNFSTGDFTFSHWIKTNTTSWSYIVSRVDSDSWNVYFYTDIDSDGVVEGAIADPYTATSSSSGYNNDTWHQVVFLRDSGTLKLYVDNSLADSADGSGISFDSNQPYIIAGCYYDWDYNYTGYFDELRVYDRAINTTEISYGYYHSGSVLNQSGLVCWLDFDEGEGSTATDDSGNGNDGSITGASWQESACKPSPTVSQDSPSNSATETSWTVDFNYTVTYYGTVKNASLRIFNSTDDSLITTIWNTTTLQNATSLSQGSYTFSVEQSYKWDCLVYDDFDNSYQSSSNWTLTIDLPPQYRNQGQNATVVDRDGTIKLYAESYDATGLDWAWLATDESGSWKNYTQSSTQYYSLSINSSTISGNPTQRHGFQPAHKTNIEQVNKTIDGNKQQYVAYDCDVAGSEIRLYYTNNTSGTWTPYSGNPILTSVNHYRWPSTAWVDSTFHMILQDRTDTQIERWTSTDGINFTFQEAVVDTTTSFSTPFIWFDPNDNIWRLYYKDDFGVARIIKTRNATNIEDLDGAADTNVLSKDAAFGSPSIMYRDGFYWLLAETQPSLWNINAYVSTSPNSGFSECDNSPILTSDEACGLHFMDLDGETAYLFSNRDSSNWYQDTRQLSITSTQYHFSIDMEDAADTWTWANFTWTNSSVPLDTDVQWLIRYNDTYGNVNATDIMTFTVIDTPSIGEFSTPATIHGDQWISLTVRIHDEEGTSDFVNATVEIMGDLILKWDASEGFSKHQDLQGYCDLMASSSEKTTINSSSYELKWVIQFCDDYPEGDKDIIGTNTLVYDSHDATGTGSHTSLFNFLATPEDQHGSPPVTPPTKPPVTPPTEPPVTPPKRPITPPPFQIQTEHVIIAIVGIGVGALYLSQKRKKTAPELWTQLQRRASQITTPKQKKAKEPKWPKGKREKRRWKKREEDWE